MNTQRDPRSRHRRRMGGLIITGWLAVTAAAAYAATVDAQRSTGSQPEASVAEAVETMPTPPAIVGPQMYVGLELGAAEELADVSHVEHRVVTIDGVVQSNTPDFRPDRLGFNVRAGVVVSVILG